MKLQAFRTNYLTPTNGIILNIQSDYVRLLEFMFPVDFANSSIKNGADIKYSIFEALNIIKICSNIEYRISAKKFVLMIEERNPENGLYEGFQNFKDYQIKLEENSAEDNHTLPVHLDAYKSYIGKTFFFIGKRKGFILKKIFENDLYTKIIKKRKSEL